MIGILSKIFIKNRDNVTDPAVRRAYGTLCGLLGIFLNVILFALKYFAGTASGSIAITADAFNNLSDAGSSVITLAGFALAGRKPDPGHPFGHGRLEYLTGLAVSGLIVIMGVELGRTSIAKIFSPEPVQSGWLPAVILAVSILVKVYMALYNRAVGRKISSTAMSATATDSLSDSIATAVVLLSMGISYFTEVNIDAYAGTLVAAFIVYAGISAARDTMSPLLGQAPEKEFVDKIWGIAMAHPEIKGIHDLLVHDYGPGRVMISLHAEVDGSGNIFELHDVIDNIELQLRSELGCLATVHMDPIEYDNSEVSRLREEVTAIVHEVSPEISIHDFRMVPGPTHTNLIFDAVMPYGLGLSDSEASQQIKKLVSERLPNHFAVINIDKSYV